MSFLPIISQTNGDKSVTLSTKACTRGEFITILLQAHRRENGFMQWSFLTGGVFCFARVATDTKTYTVDVGMFLLTIYRRVIYKTTILVFT